MVSKSRLIGFVIVVPLIIIVVVLISIGNRTPSLKKALNEYIASGQLNSEDNRLLSNIAREFVKGTPFEDKVVINAAPQSDAINVYVLNRDPKQYFQGLSCNCAYVGQGNVIVCDEKLLQHFRHLIDIPNGQIPSLTQAESDSIIKYTNTRFSFFLLQWIIGHEIGHLVLGHDGSEFYFQPSSIFSQPNNETTTKIDRQHEQEADKFVIQQLSVSQPEDQFWGWLALSNVVSNMYDQAKNEQKTESSKIKLADSPDVHPPWLIRSLDMATLLINSAPYAADRTGYFDAIRQSIEIVSGGSQPHTLCDVKLNALPNEAQLPSSPIGDDYRGYVQKGFEYWQLTEYESAISEFTKGIDLMVMIIGKGYQPPPELLESYLQRGVIYFVQGKYDLAIADWKSAISVQPSDTRAYNNLGFAYYDLDRLDDAIAEWQVSISIDPSSQSAHPSSDDSWAGLGIAYYGKGQIKEAISAYKKALAIEPNYSSLEWMRYERSWSEKSLQAAAKLLELLKP